MFLLFQGRKYFLEPIWGTNWRLQRIRTFRRKGSVWKKVPYLQCINIFCILEFLKRENFAKKGNWVYYGAKTGVPVGQSHWISFSNNNMWFNLANCIQNSIELEKYREWDASSIWDFWVVQIDISPSGIPGISIVRLHVLSVLGLHASPLLRYNRSHSISFSLNLKSF